MIWSIPGRDEAGAARDDQMGDSGDRGDRVQPRDRLERELRRGLGIDLHPGAGEREPVMIEAARLDRRAAVLGRRQTDQRCSIPDRSAIRSEQVARARSSPIRASAQSMKALWTSWPGPAVPMALM